MRALVWVPLAVLLTVAVGWAVCRAAHVNVPARDVAIAAGASLAAGLLAVVPLVLARGASQAGVAQAALVGTTVHLFVLIVAAGVVFLRHLAGPAFLYWVLALYGVTLLALVAAFAGAIKSAPTSPGTGGVAAADPKPAR
jgi:hypothetical protein